MASLSTHRGSQAVVNEGAGLEIESHELLNGAASGSCPTANSPATIFSKNITCEAREELARI